MPAPSRRRLSLRNLQAGEDFRTYRRPTRRPAAVSIMTALSRFVLEKHSSLHAVLRRNEFATVEQKVNLMQTRGGLGDRFAERRRGSVGQHRSDTRVRARIAEAPAVMPAPPQ